MNLSPDQHRQLEQLITVFLSENEKLNLSAFRTKEQCEVGNVMDSLAFVDAADKIIGKNWMDQDLSILDIGTGGGFPLLPLAIAMSHARFTGLDATLKKVDAVDRIIRAMQLTNVKMLSGRAEEYGQQKKYRGQFDVVLFRAVAPISTLLEYGIPLLKIGGKAVLWKSMHVADEMRQSANAMKELKSSFVEAICYTLPGDWGERQLLVYKKEGETDRRYPRRVGEAKSHPL